MLPEQSTRCFDRYDWVGAYPPPAAKQAGLHVLLFYLLSDRLSK